MVNNALWNNNFSHFDWNKEQRNFRSGLMKTPYYCSFGLYGVLPLSSNFFKLHSDSVPWSTTAHNYHSISLENDLSIFKVNLTVCKLITGPVN